MYLLTDAPFASTASYLSTSSGMLVIKLRKCVWGYAKLAAKLCLAPAIKLESCGALKILVLHALFCVRKAMTEGSMD